MILGVCSWLEQKFGIDATLIRIGFVVFTLLGGAGILLYVILGIMKQFANT